MTQSAADLDAFEKSINDAAAQFGVIWISFLTFATYLVITVGSVTHRMLFEESPVKLPVFGVEHEDALVGVGLVADEADVAAIARRQTADRRRRPPPSRSPGSQRPRASRPPSLPQPSPRR